MTPYMPQLPEYDRFSAIVVMLGTLGTQGSIEIAYDFGSPGPADGMAALSVLGREGGISD